MPAGSLAGVVSSENDPAPTKGRVARSQHNGLEMKRSLIVIMLGLIAAACSATPAPTTTTAPPPLPDLELSQDGLGDVAFGLSPDEVIAEMAGRFGAPDHDTDWIPAEPNAYGLCPGEKMRAIGWGSLAAIFIDDGTSDLGGYFYTYTYGYDYSENTGGVDPRGLDLTTAEGVGLGTTVADLRAAYASDLTVDGDQVLDVWTFRDDAAGLKGLLSGPDETDTVTLIQPIIGCT